MTEPLDHLSPNTAQSWLGRRVAGVLQVVGVLTVANFLITGPRAFSRGWLDVLARCLAGALLLWAGFVLERSTGGDREAVSHRRVVLLAWFGLAMAIAAVCVAWRNVFGPGESYWLMDLLLAVVIPSATIAVSRRAGWLRGWVFSIVATSSLMTVYSLPLQGHGHGRTQPWLALADAVWLGLAIGSLTWGVAASVSWLFGRVRGWATRQLGEENNPAKDRV